MRPWRRKACLAGSSSTIPARLPRALTSTNIAAGRRRYMASMVSRNATVWVHKNDAGSSRMSLGLSRGNRRATRPRIDRDSEGGTEAHLIRTKTAMG